MCANCAFHSGPSPNKDVLSATIKLQPGTYHLKFIVDGDMVLSKNLPTAVDFTNSLVNYIEVVPKEGQLLVPGESSAIPVPYRAPPGVHPPLTLPPTPELLAISGSHLDASSSLRGSIPGISQSLKLAEDEQFHNEIPLVLKDLDAAEETKKYQRTNAVTSTSLPPPPSLPQFMGKSILNGTTPMKDDASVLILPNHTVLNHLATTNIKNKTLASSGTTRYGRKVGAFLSAGLLEHHG
jgi:hypothetical protein